MAAIADNEIGTAAGSLCLCALRSGSVTQFYESRAKSEAPYRNGHPCFNYRAYPNKGLFLPGQGRSGQVISYSPATPSHSFSHFATIC